MKREVFMNEIIEYLPFVIPIFIVELGLMVVALVHLLKHKRFRFGNQIMWILIVVFLQIIGPILYFTIGRGEE
jgi:hypothetical protein